MRLTAKEITAITGWWIEKIGEGMVTGVSVDSRTLKAGDVFFALRGERFDGHDFLAQAVAAGAAGLVVEERATLDAAASAAVESRPELFVIRTPDTLRALGDLAAEVRRRYQGKVVAITGSNGKTTTKEMAASILGTRWKTAKSPGNFNNLVGVPLSIFQVKEEHQALVLEAGMNHPGEIGRLTDIAYPDVGVITCIAPAHLAFLKDIAGIREAKGELLERMKTNAVAVLNADDENVLALSRKFKGRIVTFGMRPGADIRAEKMVARVGGRTSFDMVTSQGRTRVSLGFLGFHNIQNALAAAAACLALGFGEEEIGEGLARCRPLAMRLEPIALPGGVTLINDTYNANPGSVRAAVDALLTVVCRGHRYVLLGDMLELGDQSVRSHHEIGEYIASRGVDVLVTVGADTEFAAKAFSHTAPGRKWRHLKTPDEAANLLARELKSGDVVLVKGSRGMAMEKAIQTLERGLRGSGGGGE